MRVLKLKTIDWLDAPPDAAWSAANSLLDRLGATDQMMALPLSPRLAKLVLEASRLGVAERGCAAAAVLSAGERGASDLLVLMERDWEPQTRRVYDQLRRLAPGKNRGGDGEIMQAVLAAFPDRVAKHRRDGELLLASGGAARLPDCHHDYVIAIDIEDRRDRGLPLIRLASRVEPEWLLERAEERTTLEWNREAERVEQVTALIYDQLVIEETRSPASPGDGASKMLAEQAREVDIGRFVDRDDLAQFRERALFAGIEIDVDAALERLCTGRTSFAELESANLLAQLRPPNLDRAAPQRLRLPGGREVKVHYEPGKPPWIESRLQDFFGMRESPRIGGAPIVVHLLAPNHRPVQVTSDLAGFWERLYPQMRKELSRRYPKHRWPEKPV